MSPTTAPPQSAASFGDHPRRPSMERIQQAAALANASVGAEGPAAWPAPGARRSSRLAPGFFLRGKSEEEKKSAMAAHPVFFAVFSSNPADLDAALSQDPDGARRPLLGDDPDFRDDPTNYTPLHLAAFLNDPIAVKKLIERGAEPTRFIAGVSSVGMAAYSGCHHALKAMLEMGADARLTLKPEHSLGSAGSTLLHRILEREDGKERLAITQTLILSGQYPDPLLKTEAGVSPLDYAAESDDLSVQWLRSYVAALEGLELGETVAAAPEPRGPKAL